MYYQIDNNGFYLGIIKNTNEEMEFYTDIPIEGNFIKFKFDGEKWIEGATEEEILEYKKLITPQEIQLWRIRTILKLMQLEQTIETALEQLDEPNKTAALSVWNYGTTIERYSQTVLLLQSILQMTDKQVDDIFIQAYNIVI